MESTISSSTETEPHKPLPYRWGYFQGVVLIPFSLLVLLGTLNDLLLTHHSSRYVALVALLIGLMGIPLGVGLLVKKKFALTLVYMMFSLVLSQAAIQILIAVRHFAEQGDSGSAFFEAELLLVWLLSMVYYRKRRHQFS